jgi:hypothetical protein
VTTNPTIFALALSKDGRYNGQLRDLVERGADPAAAVFAAQRTAEAVDAARDHVDHIADTQRSEQDAQLNEITKNSPHGRPSSLFPPPSPASTGRTSPTRTSAATPVSSPAASS